MFPQKRQISVEPDPKTYPLVEQIDSLSADPAMALVALNHTPVERRIYAAMLGALEVSAADSNSNSASASAVFFCPSRNGAGGDHKPQHRSTRTRRPGGEIQRGASREINDRKSSRRKRRHEQW